MKTHRLDNRVRLIGLPMLLLVVALVGAACAPATPAAPGTATTPAPTSVPAVPATTAPAQPEASPAPVSPLDLPMGVDSDGNFYRGDTKAPVKMIEFSDFQCPYCGRHVAETGPQLDSTYVATGQVLHVFRHFPLTEIHPNALPSAKAAYCAGQQDPKFFWGLHDWLFATQATWSSAPDALDQIRKQAVALGVDGAKYDTCLTDAATEARIQRDLQDGMAAGVQGTPAFLINDWFLGGAYPFAEFKTTIEKAQQGLHPAPTPTPLPAGVQFYDVDPARPGLTYDGSPTLGDANAPLLLLGFEDLKSGDGAQYVKAIEPALQDKYIKDGKLRVMVKLFPTAAPKAAAAAVCATSQGKFWEFRDALYSHQTEWQDGDEAAMTGYAKTVGLDEAKFKACLTDPQTQAQVDAALAFGQQVGVPQVPAFLIVDLKQGQVVGDIVGAPVLADFEAKLDAALNPPTPEPAATPAPVATPAPTP
jgi:protein-disulfide isomerase